MRKREGVSVQNEGSGNGTEHDRKKAEEGRNTKHVEGGGWITHACDAKRRWVHPRRPMSLCRAITSSCMHARTGLLLFGGLHRLSFLKQSSLVKSSSATH